MKKILVYIFLVILAVPVLAQKPQDLKREVTLYNPYKPSLPDVVKKSFLPDMTDTTGSRPQFNYNVRTFPFMPAYSIVPVKPAALLPDPLPKLYKSYVNIGFGTYVTPLAEVSISSLRSKKGQAGFYARHFSTNGNIDLLNDKKGFAGYMDNDATLYGKKFLNKTILSGSIDFMQKTRYAYGYDTAFNAYDPAKKQIKLNYYNAGAEIDLASAKLDSSVLSYDFRVAYNYFAAKPGYFQNNIDITAQAGREWKGFYAGGLADFSYYKPSDSISSDSKYHVWVNPFVKKTSGEWSLKLGLKMLLDKHYDQDAEFHIYPDIDFGFNIVPNYIRFFAGLGGGTDENDAASVLSVNPYLIPGKTLFTLKHTNYSLIVKGGFTGETGIGGTYNLSASYSIVNDMLFFSNYVLTDSTAVKYRGEYFIPLSYDAEILDVKGSMSGRLGSNLAFDVAANYYSYSMPANEYAWNKPGWDASLGLKYNLRNKIMAGFGMNALGPRKVLVTRESHNPDVNSREQIDLPTALSFNLSAEYRYTKLLSFWVRFNNINFSKYYEWAYFPSQRFLFLAGFTYSL